MYLFGREMGPLISGKSRLVKYYFIPFGQMLCAWNLKKNPCIDSIDSLQIIPRNGEDKFPNDFLKLSYDLLHPQQLYIYMYIQYTVHIYIYSQTVVHMYFVGFVSGFLKVMFDYFLPWDSSPVHLFFTDSSHFLKTKLEIPRNRPSVYLAPQIPTRMA